MHPLLASLFTDTWAMESAALERFMDSMCNADWKSAGMLESEPTELAPEIRGGVAIIPIAGMLLPRVPGIFRAFGIEATSYADISNAVRKAADDPAIARIVLAVNSPGGSVSGVHAAADAILAARDVKPITAEVSGMAASAAYWLASQASTIVADRGAVVGSIGVYGVMHDMSRAAENAGIRVHVIASTPLKGAGVPGAPITDAQLADRRRMIDSASDQFIADIARGLGKSTKDASAFATGQVWSAQEAHASGLIHGIQSAQDFTHMDAFALIEKHPAHAALIAGLAKQGKTVADMEAAIDRADAAAAHAALVGERDALKASVEKLTADSKSVADALAAEKARADKATADFDALKAHVDGGKAGAKIKPDGDEKTVEKLTHADAVKKYGDRIAAAKIADGEITLI